MFIQFVQQIPQRCGSKLAWARVCMLFGVLNFKYALYALMAWLLPPGLKAFLAGAFCWASQGPGFTDSEPVIWGCKL